MKDLLAPNNIRGSIFTEITTAFPALRALALFDLDAASSQYGVLLQPLSQLKGLEDLRLSSHHIFAGVTLDSISSLRQLASLELHLLYDATTTAWQLPAILERSSSLCSLQHLTHLSFTCTLGAAGSSLTLQGLGDEAAISGLTSCHRLASLQLPWAKLTTGAAESLASGLPQLKQLTVSEILPAAPMPPCSWREIHLRGRLQSIHDLIKLPLSGLDSLHLAHLQLGPLTPGRVETLFRALEQYTLPLAARLRGLSQITLDCGWFHMGGTQLTGLLTSIVALGGATLTDFTLARLPVRHLLQRSHFEVLAAGLPRLTQLSLLHHNLAPDAWPHLGALGLHTLHLHGGRGNTFTSQHFKLLASPVTRHLHLVLWQGDVNAARIGLERLLAARHVCARFISLSQQSESGEPPTKVPVWDNTEGGRWHWPEGCM